MTYREEDHDAPTPSPMVPTDAEVEIARKEHDGWSEGRSLALGAIVIVVVAGASVVGFASDERLPRIAALAGGVMLACLGALAYAHRRAEDALNIVKRAARAKK